MAYRSENARWIARNLPALLDQDRAADEKTVAERKWRSPIKPAKAQEACDAGLFSDQSQQKELF